MHDPGCDRLTASATRDRGEIGIHITGAADHMRSARDDPYLYAFPLELMEDRFWLRRFGLRKAHRRQANEKQQDHFKLNEAASYTRSCRHNEI